MADEKPNILLIQTDQHTPHSLPCYGNKVVSSPNIDSLAEDGVVFESAYCNNPICAPSRFSMMAGQHTSRIGAWDNGAEFPADIPTFAHYLRTNGYRTCLSGKMHFVGGDQLHGFEERLTTDVYPADHGWTPDWRNPEYRFDWWYHNMSSVTEAGPCERTNQIDFDDETEFHATRWIYDTARDEDERPFCLVISFTDPHDPYACPREHWDRYSQEGIDLPETESIPEEERDPHSRRLRYAYQADSTPVTEEDVKNARRAYYGQISYIDDKIGRLLKALDDSGLRENTVVVFTADHGDMLGEKGMWYKMSFFERSARVPFIVSAPNRFSPKRVSTPVSLVDLLPTFLDLSGDERLSHPADTLDGESLVPMLREGDGEETRTVISEFFAEGSIAPCFMVRRGRFKYIYSQPDPPQLYDLHNDPRELSNLASDTEYGEILQTLHQVVLDHQNPERVNQEVLDSQKRRRVVFNAHMTGKHTPWDFQPVQDSANKYMRNHRDLNDVEGKARIPSKK
ncbi:MAG: choline-sulfatase [Desulfohalobiaceae bacterium]|nr:choline-sulfatase [Desulfohalobiaceae bacterium]